MKQSLSPRDLADAIGVSESSLKRWVDAGRIQVARTEGGHRRIPMAEAIRFIRSSGAAIVRPDLLGVTAPPVTHSFTDDEALFHMLSEGQAREARGWLVARYLAGESVAMLADGPIRSAMTRLGELWRHDDRGVFIEHRATECCLQAVAALRSLIDPPHDAPIAVGGAPAGDPYLLPSMLASIALASEGIRPVNLGPDTPIVSLRHAVATHHPALVWLSCSAPLSPPLADEIAGFAKSLPTGVTFVVGGHHAHELSTARTAYKMNTIAELSAFARGLVAAQTATEGGA